MTVDSSNAANFLSKGVYARWQDPQVVDTVTTELVQATFGKFSRGEFSLPTLIKSLREPVRERRLLLWANDDEVQAQLEQLSISGTIPGDPGPFAMTVVNNGGGNKMDAYLQVDTRYDPGTCTNSARVGQISVTLDNTAPKDGEGLPSYVNVRSDLIQRGLTGKVTRDGSNRIILDIYGPVGSSAVLTQLDGETVVPVTGLDNNHPVWRVSVPIAAGQERTVNVVMSTPVVEDDAGQIPVVLNQPMVKPATSSAEPLTECKTHPSSGDDHRLRSTSRRGDQRVMTLSRINRKSRCGRGTHPCRHRRRGGVRYPPDMALTVRATAVRIDDAKSTVTATINNADPSCTTIVTVNGQFLGTVSGSSSPTVSGVVNTSSGRNRVRARTVDCDLKENSRADFVVPNAKLTGQAAAVVKEQVRFSITGVEEASEVTLTAVKVGGGATYSDTDVADRRGEAKFRIKFKVKGQYAVTASVNGVPVGNPVNITVS